MENPHAIFDSPPLTEGEWAGWVLVSGTAFEDYVGPLYFQEDAEGRAVCAARVEPRHGNPAGGAHGGFLMTLVDMSLFAISRKALDCKPAVTVALNSEFVGPAPIGEIVRASGEVVRAGGSLIFVRGLVTAGGAPALAFNGIVRKFR